VAKVQEAARELEAATQNKPPKGVTPVRVEGTTFKWSDWLWQGSNGVAKFAAQMFVVLFLVFYMLIAGDMYKRKLVRIAPTLSNKKLTVQILAEIDRQIERFLMARLLISAIIGVAVWMSFRVIGIEEPGLWGVLAAVLFAIPIVGPTVVVIGAFIAGFLQFGSAAMGGVAAAACLVIGLLEGNILTPLLMSRAGEMNAVAVFVSLIFWGWLWGVWGLLLAVPITAALKAVCDRVEEYSAFAELLR
jgi:predicted PurR-regulated permease PerM